MSDWNQQESKEISKLKNKNIHTNENLNPHTGDLPEIFQDAQKYGKIIPMQFKKPIFSIQNIEKQFNTVINNTENDKYKSQRTYKNLYIVNLFYKKDDDPAIFTEKIDAVTTQITKLKQEFAEHIQAEIESNTRIAEIEQELSDFRNTQNEQITARTQQATKAKQEKNLAKWQGAFKVMLPVFLRCQAEGEKARTRADLDRMCGDRKLTSAQMDFLRECLRECLGPEYVNTTGGPTIQG